MNATKRRIAKPAWRSMRTAPRDGTLVIVIFDWDSQEPSIQSARWEPDTEAWEGDDGGLVEPDGWMPIPPRRKRKR